MRKACTQHTLSNLLFNWENCFYGSLEVIVCQPHDLTIVMLHAYGWYRLKYYKHSKKLPSNRQQKRNLTQCLGHGYKLLLEIRKAPHFTFFNIF